MKNRIRILQTSALLLLTVLISAQRPGMQNNQPGIIKWLDDNRMLLQTFDEQKKIVISEYDCKTGKSVVVTDYKSDAEKLREMLPEGVQPGLNQAVASDRRAVVLSRDNDLWYVTVEDRTGKRLTNDPDQEVNMRFAPGDRKIAYTKNKDLYVFDLDQQREIRLTFDATDKIYNGWASWVYFEEILGRASRYAAFWWSPDATRIAYLHTDDNPVPLFNLNGLEDTDGIHGRMETTPYPKPGDPNPKVKMGVVELATVKTTWVKTDDNIDQYIAWPSWTPDSRSLMIQVLNRDQNDMRFILADVATGDFREVYARPGLHGLIFLKTYM